MLRIQIASTQMQTITNSIIRRIKQKISVIKKNKTEDLVQIRCKGYEGSVNDSDDEVENVNTKHMFYHRPPLRGCDQTREYIKVSFVWVKSRKWNYIYNLWILTHLCMI